MNTRSLARTALIAAVYTAVCLALPFLSYNVVQIRFSEALTLLPVLMPEAIWGLTIGCFLSNLIGTFLGTTLPLDIVVGTLATFLAALATRGLAGLRWNRLAIPAMLPPILFNAVIVGAELTYLYSNHFTVEIFAFNAATIAIGQLVSCTLGVVLVWMIEKNASLKRHLK